MGEPHEDLEGLGPHGQARQAPLALRHDVRILYPELSKEIGVDDVGASIVACLFSEAEGRGRETSYSRANDHYKGRRKSPRYNRNPICLQVDYLDELGLINHDKAPPARYGWQSFMSPTPELIGIVRQAIVKVGRPKLLKPRDAIIVRDANGMMIERQEKREEFRMRRQVERINEALGSISISDQDGGDHSAYGARIFNQSTDRNGRIYMQGSSFQSLPKVDRKRLLIDGEEVEELDFKALHPSFLYAEVGLPVPEDCYDIGSWPRPLVKVALLILMNAKNSHSARRAIAYHDTMATLAVPGSRVAEGLAEKLLTDIKHVHAPIARFFHKDKGAHLMRKDSEIAVRVVLAMRDRGEVVLPVHDSFIVRASKAEELRGVMFDEACRAGLIAPKIVS